MGYPNYLHLPMEFVNELNIYELVVYSFLLNDLKKNGKNVTYILDRIAKGLNLTPFLIRKAVNCLETKGFIKTTEKKVYEIIKFPEKWEFEFIPYKVVKKLD